LLVTLLLVESVRQWMAVLNGTKEPKITESPFVVTRLAEEQR